MAEATRVPVPDGRAVPRIASATRIAAPFVIQSAAAAMPATIPSAIVVLDLQRGVVEARVDSET